MIKYIVEKGYQMPLCAIKDNIYFDYLTGQVIDNENTIAFIKSGLNNKSMVIKEIDIVIYEIGYIAGNGDYYGCYYNFIFNGCSNYLGSNKQPLDNDSRKHVIDKLMAGKYKQRLIWGEECD